MRALSREMGRRLQYAAQSLDASARRLVHPGERLRAHAEHARHLAARLAFAFSHRVHRCVAELERLRASLVGLDPAAVLARGYSMTRDSTGALLRDASGVREGERLTTTLARGALESEVTKKHLL